MVVDGEQAHQGLREVAAKLVEASMDRMRVQVVAAVQHSHCKALPWKSMAVLPPDWLTSGKLACQTMQAAVV